MSKMLVTDFLWVGLPLLYLADGKVVPYLEIHFLSCSIYLLVMTQESEIILTTCHKTQKSQTYYVNEVLVNGKAYIHYNLVS